EDKIDLRPFGITSWITLRSLISRSSSGNALLQIRWGNGNVNSFQTELEGITDTQLSQNDFIFSNVSDISLTGTNARDDLFGTPGNDTLEGLGGRDRLWGEAGNDSLLGGTSEDSLLGGVGNDTLLGGRDNDTLTGGIGNDIFVIELINDISGSIDKITDFTQGEDKIDLRPFGITSWITLRSLISNSGFGNAAFSFRWGNGNFNSFQTELEGITKNQLTQNDFIFYNGQSVTVTGTNFRDDLFGTSGNDTLTGEAGNDRVWGEAGDDFLSGGTGNDTIKGGTGNDTLEGGRGFDTITGGGGQDLVFFSGELAEYNITNNGDGSIIVEDTVSNRDNTDTLYWVEQARFFDQLINFDLPQPNSAPRALQFKLTKNTYQIGATLSLKDAFLYDEDGANDLKEVDIWLRPRQQNW
ncbi:MAG: hypothetical protein D6822_04820, partial [Cyanobacteria bacterium J149]